MYWNTRWRNLGRAAGLVLVWMLILAGGGPALAAAGGTADKGKITDLVDPFIGTDGTGHVFPGASVPFGMVAPSPDNADRGWSYSSGYQYRAPRILGFSNTHISGAGINELGDVLLQPVAGTPWQEIRQISPPRMPSRASGRAPVTTPSPCRSLASRWN